MATINELGNRIADDLNRTDLTTQIWAAINRAIAHYQAERTWFNETFTTITTVSGQDAYTTADGMPTDLLRLDNVQYTDASGNTYMLDRRDWGELRERQTRPTSLTGLPSRWAWRNQSLYLYPTPNAAYTVTLWYVKSYAALTTGQSNDWTESLEAQSLIESRATWWVAHRLLKDYERAAASKAEEMEALQRLQIRAGELISDGQIRPYL